MNRCGIILAGGKGTRLYPLTKTISKQLLPVFDKPMIYYPLSLLMRANIRDILIIGSDHLNLIFFMNLFGDGSDIGIKLSYKIQKEPIGIAHAFILAKSFIKDRPVVLALGDNIFYGSGIDHSISNINDDKNLIFGCKVSDPTAYGVASFDDDKFVGVVEKPKTPPSDYAVPGLYFYDNTIVDKALSLKPSKRGELEITDITNLYIKESNIDLIRLPFVHWFDCGTHEGLLEASQFIYAVQKRTGRKIGDIKEIAINKRWIDK